MNIEERLNITLNKFIRSGEIEDFRNTVSHWLIEEARYKIQIKEECISEVYIRLSEKLQRFVELYQEREIKSLIGFLYIFTKNIYRNVRKKMEVEESDDFLKLWNEPAQKNLITNIQEEKVWSLLRQTRPITRLLVYLRYNIEIDPVAYRYLNKYLKRYNLSPLEFRRELLIRKENLKTKQKKIIGDIVKYNRSLFRVNDNEKYKNLVQRKKLLSRRLRKREVLFTSEELSKVFRIKRERILRDTNECIRKMERNGNDNHAA